MRPYVLLIEDDADAIELNRRAFEAHGRFDVIAIPSGRDALDFLRRAGPHRDRDEAPPALVILDLGLPDLPGLEVLTEIKQDETLAFLPVVVLTISESPNDIRRAQELGANFFVTKPVRHEDFENTVNIISAFWSTAVHTPTPPTSRF